MPKITDLLKKGENKAENEANQSQKDISTTEVEVVQEKPENSLKAQSNIQNEVLSDDMALNKPVSEAKQDKDDEITEKPQKPHKQPEKAENNDSVSNVVDSSGFGVDSDEIQEVYGMSQQEEELFKLLNSYARSKEILWGTIGGVEIYKNINKIVIVALFNGIKVSISEDEFFEPTFDFKRYEPAYATLSERKQMLVRERLARFQIGANICFILKDVLKLEGEGGTVINAVASRREAMKKRRQYFFVDSDNKPNVNSLVKNASILSVNENKVTVEVCGVETRIDAYDLNNYYVQNCHDYVSPGDVMTVRIKRIYMEGDDIYLVVTGRTKTVNKNLSDIKVGSSYAGVVENYNAKTKAYSVRLFNGVGASVGAKSVENGVSLSIGDRVQVAVNKKLPTFVVGRARKI